jgi:hypothetical protein
LLGSRARIARVPVIALALLLSAAFGAGDQYLGSLTGSGHLWATGWSTDVSLLSAPWLVLPFVAGATRDPRRAALLGLACAYMALVGYGLLMVSPVENARVTLATVRGFLVSERSVFVGGIVTGPLFGWFGQQWRRYRDVWLAEVAAGLVLAAAVLVRRAREG